ncbi:MAG TPA: manganese catalase family protein [Candidatus Evtepia faecavium]|nr:manganese catalase family protein [Candidatus Evtepia faecavium]
MGGLRPSFFFAIYWWKATCPILFLTGCSLMIAAEQKARVTYDNILRLAKDDPDVTDVIRFLREREIVHFQRFGSAIQQVREQLDKKNVYYTNPAFDK